MRFINWNISIHLGNKLWQVSVLCLVSKMIAWFTRVGKCAKLSWSTNFTHIIKERCQLLLSIYFLWFVRGPRVICLHQRQFFARIVPVIVYDPDILDQSKLREKMETYYSQLLLMAPLLDIWLATTKSKQERIASKNSKDKKLPN